MAMKETENSLRWYFLLAGAIAILLVVRDGAHARELSGAAELPADWMLALYVPLVSRCVIGVAFLVAGIKLKRALLTGAGWIKKVLVASAVVLFVNGALITSVLGTDVGRAGLTGAIIGLVITIYLHRSITRLAAEAARREGIPPAPPIAKVV